MEDDFCTCFKMRGIPPGLMMLTSVYWMICCAESRTLCPAARVTEMAKRPSERNSERKHESIISQGDRLHAHSNCKSGMNQDHPARQRTVQYSAAQRISFCQHMSAHTPLCCILRASVECLLITLVHHSRTYFAHAPSRCLPGPRTSPNPVKCVGRQRQLRSSARNQIRCVIERGL